MFAPQATPASPSSARFGAHIGSNSFSFGETRTRYSWKSGEWTSDVASRKNDDGTTAFITIDHTIDGFDFVAAQRDATPTLTIRDAQHEYVFT